MSEGAGIFLLESAPFLCVLHSLVSEGAGIFLLESAPFLCVLHLSDSSFRVGSTEKRRASYRPAWVNESAVTAGQTQQHRGSACVD